MEKNIKYFLSALDDGTKKELPVSFYGMQPAFGGKQRIVHNKFHRSEMYVCTNYHKPISKIYDINKVYTPKGIEINGQEENVWNI